ncbi:MAG TPA: hypothetical protein ENL34_07355 [Chloroflexi bacterium]|nr:hypothetical protein [Chloroflexota bacterium]
MPLIFPSYQALALADQILETVADRVPGYQGRLGAYWYWRLPGGILVTYRLDFTVTEQRWDVLRAEAVTPKAGTVSRAEFPFAMYGTLLESPPFIHDLEGEAQWSNRLYFQMGHLIEDATLWMETLLATILDPQISPPSSFPNLTSLERELVHYAIEELRGRFQIKQLHQAFGHSISYRALANLARRWEEIGLLTERPRRVTIALRMLVEQSETNQS